jgi:GT2 family glycosyltransferase
LRVPPQSPERVYILILNWNGWRDTTECLESVFRSDYSNYRVVVCDNDSGDGSFEYIKMWAEGKLDPVSDKGHSLHDLCSPPVSKPIPFVEYDRARAEVGGDEETDFQLVLIQTGVNLGFAGGNNVGLRYILRRGDFQYVWILNNDTVVRSDALAQMVLEMRERPDAGICGSTLLYYDEPDIVQTLGGATYNRWLGSSKYIGTGRSAYEPVDPQRVEKSLTYVTGASMLVSRKFIESIGLMDEDYFLFFEEIDWAVRGRERFGLTYAPKSVVYHKEGRSVGSTRDPAEKSLTADLYGIRSRLLFTRKFFPMSLPTVYLGLLVTAFNRVRRRQYGRLAMVVRVALGLEKIALGNRE